MRERVVRIVLLSSGAVCLGVIIGYLVGSWRHGNIEEREVAETRMLRDDKADLCSRVLGNLDDLRAGRAAVPAHFSDRVKGAEWFLFNGVRYCTGKELGKRMDELDHALDLHDDDLLDQHLAELQAMLDVIVNGAGEK